MKLAELNKTELSDLLNSELKKYDEYKTKNLKLDMSRGKPGADQLDITAAMLSVITSNEDCFDTDGTDCRNYGVLDGIPSAKKMFAELLEVGINEILVGGNSSLNMMYDTIARAMSFGVLGSEKPWGKYEKIKFLCPVPGYDRHFSICQLFGIEMINITMNSDGPDMDEIEALVSSDDTIKGIWCVPMYSNPDGITYSDEVVKRFANLKPKAKDFRILWDNAYAVHHLPDTKDNLLNILDECKKVGNADIVFEFTSTSKVSYPGAGVAAMAASEANLTFIKKQLFVQTIGPDKLNQLRHSKYFKNYDGILAQMEKHKQILAPKFEAVLEKLDKEFSGLGIAEWNKPNGGYFVSLNTIDGCAKRALALAKEAGVTMTPAGATFPYGKDPKDRNIRIAPTFPPVSELNVAMELFCICVKIACIEKLLEN